MAYTAEPEPQEPAPCDSANSGDQAVSSGLHSKNAFETNLLGEHAYYFLDNVNYIIKIHKSPRGLGP